MHPSKEIDAKLQAYFERRIGLDELRAWYKEAGGSLFDTENAQILDLAASLQLAFIEYDKGEFSERQLKRYLRQCVRELQESKAGTTSR